MITMDIRIIVIFRTMSFEFFFGIESLVAKMLSVDGEVGFAVPNVEGAGVCGCFVVTPVCVGVEDRAAPFDNCANVSSHGCRSV